MGTRHMCLYKRMTTLELTAAKNTKIQTPIIRWSDYIYETLDSDNVSVIKYVYIKKCLTETFDLNNKSICVDMTY